MYAPSQRDVRMFFCDVLRKHREGAPLTPMEALANDWISQHPEYNDALGDVNAALEADYKVETGQTNPFLHLSMHLTITEQVAIDQPKGIAQSVRLMSHRHGSLHEAHHQVMECLGEMIWASQRSGLPPDGHAYLDCVQRRSTA